jgi:transcriptional regulator with XRE-family HTH domain
LAKESKKLIGSRGGSISSGDKKANPVDIIVGENIRRLRSQCGMSQEQLGMQSGVTFQQIQKYEKGSNRVSASRLDQFAVLFGVDHNSFFIGASSVRNTSSEEAERLILSSKAFKLGRLFDELGDKKKQKALFALIAQLSGDVSVDLGVDE